MRTVDVAIVGAGAAGLAAARRADELGLSVFVFEAKPRIGGRAFTDTGTFGIPWDRGAHWLHSADANPLTRIADELGHPYLVRPRPFDGRFHLGQGWGGKEDWRAYRDEFENAMTRAVEAGEEGRDIVVSDLLDNASRWRRMVHHIFTAISGQPPSDISTADLAAYRDTEANWPLERGYGALLEAHYAGLPVELSTPVTGIDTSGTDIVLDTPRGTARARSLIVTVSTNVLASGTIRFTPALPVAVQTALAGVPTGSANKVAFHFRGDVFGLPDTSYVNFMDERDAARPACSFQIRPFGTNLAIAYLGGDLADNLERAGEAEMVDFARAVLGDMFGTGIFKELAGVAATAWTTDPHTRGAYSCALPGEARQRAVLAEPVSERFFLAGEAVSADWFSTVQGAHVTGIEAADRAAAFLGRAIAEARGR
ncbi:amine oxidase [Parvibaculum lavamentivorans DS-1]|uniref:Tryptophan 2-monooxygenase n=1 Tax=Parvibaculum lavamentivorans (strain DS-1 / DSM 13023 / NCIMB 13966) TaxID=402881 RepID=A7HVX9_PARL1|nr:NAD(P)/FAD-dependent oxidoreductase [Parvibaculum lavamentivorans]ABS64062.1 amine oxidase [Parvibaculum lavamentivorans DS-1]